MSGTELLELQRSIYRELGKRGWDKTARGWMNIHTGLVLTMDAAIQQEIDNAGLDRKEEAR